MTITLPPDYERFIDEILRSDGYRSPADVVCDGLELLRAQTTYRRQQRARFKEEVENGMEEMRRNEVSPADPLGLLAEVESEFNDLPRTQP